MKRLLLILFFHIVAIQAMFAQLEIETTVPTGFDEAINVGVGTGNFETIVVNKGVTQESILGITISYPDDLQGLEIMSARCKREWSEYPVSIEGNSLRIEGGVRLMPGEQISFEYEKRATCEVVPLASSGYSMQVVDEITVLGTNYSGQSNSYPVLFPGLSVIVPESPLNNKQVGYLENFSDEVVIRNEQNSGKVSSLIIRMEYNQQVLSVNKVEIQGSAGTIEREIASNGVEIVLGSADFMHLGFPDGVMPSNSQIQMIVSGQVEKYAATTQVRYTADYQTFDISCKRLKNAEGVKYFNQTAPNPQMAVDIAVVQKGDLCGRQIIFDAVCRNNSLKTPVNSILDGYIDITSSNLIIDKVEIGGWVVSKTSRGYELPRTDVNQNSELKGGDSIVFRVYAKARQSTIYNRTGLYCYFYGQDVSGKKLSTYRQTNDQIYDAQVAIEGPGTLDVRKLPQGTYTCSCEAKKIPIDGTMLLDYDVWAYVGNSPIRNLSFDQYGKTSETFETVIRACQEDEIQLRMVVKSDGCPGYQVLSEAKANVVQRCWDEEMEYEEYFMSSYDDISEGGGGVCADSLGMEDEGDSGGTQSARKKICANIYTDTTMLGSKRATLCESVSIDSKAIVTYNCSDTKCSPPKILAVKIFDVNQQINDFFVEDITINNYRATFLRYTQQSCAKFYQYDYSSKCAQESGEVVDTIHIEARIKMPETHWGTPRKDANIQVGVGYVDNSVIKISPYTWGEELSVFDAVPTFSSTVDLGHCGRCELFVELPQTDYEGTSGIKVNKIEYPGFEDSYYSNSSINSSATVVTEEHISQGKNKSYKASIYPKCTIDGYNPQPQGVTVWYTDLADIPTCIRDTVVTVNVSRYDMEYQSPIICLYPAERQQAVGSTTTWTVRVINEGSYAAEQVMLKFTINPENTMDLMVKKIQIPGFANLNYELDDFGSYYVSIGTFLQGQSKDVEITVAYGMCAEEGISTIDVESAWSCEELSKDNFDDFNCGGTAVLELENMVAVLNVVETYPKEYYGLCENIPIHLNISNIGRAELNQIGFGFDELPSVYSVTDDIIIGSYEGRVTNITNISSVPVNNTTISQNILNRSHGVFDANSNIDVDFNVQMHCGSNLYQVDTLKFNVQSYTNCGDKQMKVFQFIPKLKGFDFLDSISVLSSTTGFTEYKGESDVLVSITNTSDVLIDSAYISVLLPKGFQYVDYTTLDDSLITGISQIPQKDGTLLLQWELQQGRHLAARETVDIQFRIRAVADCANEETLLTMCTLKRQMVDCDGNICKVAQSTEAKRVLLQPVKKDLTPILIGLDSVCVGTPLEYSVEGTGIRKVSWSFSDESVLKDSVYGNTVRIVFPQGETTILTATVEGECENNTLSKTISIADVPNILLPDTVNIKWKSLSTVLDSLYAVAQWIDAPLTIEGCGEYYETVQKENQCGLSSKNIVLQVTDCCDTVRVGDIVETEMQGITTYDVSMLMYYLKHKDALKISQDGIYQMQMRDDDVCDVKTVPLKECFEKRADMNGDGKIDEIDLELLLNQIE